MCASCDNGQNIVNINEENAHTTYKDENSSPTYYDFMGHPESEFDYDSELTFSVDDVIKAINPVEPDNIKLYIDDIISDGKFIIERNDKENMITAIRDLANKLQSYKNGEKKYFPDKELKEILTNMLGEIAYVDNHRPDIAPRDFIIFPRLLEITASLCPDISKIATYTSTDKNLGVVTIGAQFYEYDFTALITKVENVCKIHYLPQSLRKINKIRHVRSTDCSEQYLLSNEDQSLCPEYYPTIYLITLYSDGDVSIHDLSANSNFKEWNDFIYNDKESDKHQIYFNPKEICWLWCKKNKYGNLEKIEGSKTLYVDFESYSLRQE